jgi:hypothetical protein
MNYNKAQRLRALCDLGVKPSRAKSNPFYQGMFTEQVDSDWDNEPVEVPTKREVRLHDEA